MKSRTMGWWLASGLLISSALAAEPLTDLRTRLAALRNTQPIRLKVDIEIKHSERASRHRSRARASGHATIVYGPKGVKVKGQRWTSSSHSSSWSSWGTSSEQVRIAIPPIDAGEAKFLVDPADALYYLLWDATLLRNQEVTWQGQAARLLVFVPTSFGEKAASSEALWQFTGEVKLWLSGSGSPLAMQHTMKLNVPALGVKREQLFTFQEIDGRLLAAGTEDTFSGSALGWDTKTMKVSTER